MSSASDESAVDVANYDYDCYCDCDCDCDYNYNYMSGII